MSLAARVTCDHPGGCVRTLDVDCQVVTDVLSGMVAAGWHNAFRVVDGRPRRTDLCPEHKHWRPT